MKKDVKDLLGKLPQSNTDPEAEPKGKPKGREVVEFALSEEDKAKVRAKAIAAVSAKFKKNAEERLLQQYIREVEQEMVPEQQLHPLLINVAGHANKIVLDGRTYEHGRVYNVTQSEMDSLEEIMANTWRHEREVGGANFNHYRKPANAVIRPGSEIAPLHSLVHV